MATPPTGTALANPIGTPEGAAVAEVPDDPVDGSVVVVGVSPPASFVLVESFELVEPVDGLRAEGSVATGSPPPPPASNRPMPAVMAEVTAPPATSMPASSATRSKVRRSRVSAVALSGIAGVRSTGHRSGVHGWPCR